MKNKWNQDLKVLNHHQEKSFVAHTCSNEKVSCCSVRYDNDNEWTLYMKKGCAFNTSNKCFNNHIHQMKNKWKILLVVTLENEAYIYQDLWKYEQKLLHENIHYSFCKKNIFVYSCKVRKKTLKTLWTYWEKILSTDCKSVFKTIIDLDIVQQLINLLWFV